MNRLVFGMHDLNITQAGTLLDGKPHYSHPNYALDLAGSDSGVDYWKNKESDTCFYCSGYFGTRNTGNTRFFVSCDSKGKQTPIMCADGKARIITLALTHSNKDYQLYRLYHPNEIMYQEGTAGRATGNHIHLEVAEGFQKTKYWDVKLKVYRMKGEMDPRKAFYILDGYTKVVNTQGLVFKHTDTVEAKESEDETVYLKAQRMGFNIRKEPVTGSVLKVVGKGDRAEILEFLTGFKSDGYQWAKVKKGDIIGYSQLDTKYYLIEK